MFIVDSLYAHDVVLGTQAGADGRRVGHGLLHRDATAAIHLDDDAQPTELALCGGAHVLEAVDVEQHRVRIQGVEHAVGGSHFDVDEMACAILGRNRAQAWFDEGEDLAHRAAQGPRRIHALDGEDLLFTVDLDDDLLGIALGETVDQNLRHVALEEIESAHQHALGVGPRAIEVLAVHVIERLAEYLRLRELVARAVGAHGRAEGRLGGETNVLAAPFDGQDQGQRGGAHEYQKLAQAVHEGLRTVGRRPGRTVDEIHRRRTDDSKRSRLRRDHAFPRVGKYVPRP